MKSIQLTQGKATFVDDEDYLLLSQVNWHSEKGLTTYYAKRQTSKESGKLTQYMHFAIMGIPPKGCVMDHIDGDGLNNQRLNLRFVTPRQNSQNCHKKCRSSMYPGVHLQKSRKKWRARIRIGNKLIHLGQFDTEFQAFNAYCDSLKKIGEVLVL